MLCRLDRDNELGLDIGSELGVGASSDEESGDGKLGTLGKLGVERAGSDAIRGVGGKARLGAVASDDLSKLDGVITDSDSSDDSVSGREDRSSGSEPDTGRLEVGNVWCIVDGVGT